MKNYQTMSEAISDLNRRGYTLDFNLLENSLYCREKDCRLKPDEFEIDEVYRFEGETDPGDENVVYAISSASGDLKGVVVNAFGVYADPISDELIAKLHRHLKK